MQSQQKIASDSTQENLHKNFIKLYELCLNKEVKHQDHSPAATIYWNMQAGEWKIREGELQKHQIFNEIFKVKNISAQDSDGNTLLHLLLIQSRNNEDWFGRYN